MVWREDSGSFAVSARHYSRPQSARVSVTVPVATSRLQSEAQSMSESLLPCVGFREFDFTAPIDVDAHARLIPEGATVKGMFFLDAIEAMRSVAPHACEQFALARQHYASFRDYPQLDYLRLIEHAARVIHPNLPFAQGVREIAWTTFPRFARSTVGRVVVGALGNDMERLVSATAKAWSLCSNRGRVRVVRLDARHFHYEAENMQGILDPFLIGIAEGMFKHMRLPPRIMIQHNSDSDRNLCLRW